MTLAPGRERRAMNIRFRTSGVYHLPLVEINGYTFRERWLFKEEAPRTLKGETPARTDGKFPEVLSRSMSPSGRTNTPW